MRIVNIESLVHVAEKLQALDEHFAFLGGAVLPLLLDDSSIGGLRGRGLRGQPSR